MARKKSQHRLESEGHSGPSTEQKERGARVYAEDLYPHDGELMRRLGKGDAEAFEPFVLRHADAAFRLVRFMTADAPTARRVATDAFVQAFRALYPEERPKDAGTQEAGPAVEPAGLPAEYGGDFTAWILSIARRLALAEPPIPPPSREIEATGGAADPAAFRKVRELDIDLREAIVVRHAAGHTGGQGQPSYETIGRACGVSVEKTAEMLAGARHDLARILGGPSEEAREEPQPAAGDGGLGSLGTGTGIALFVTLSKHIDGKLPPEMASKVERHLKQSGRYREEIAGLRGADRLAVRAVEGVRDPGLVPAVMEALNLRARAVPMGGRRFPRPVLWCLIALAALSAGALVAAGLYALFGGKQKEHRVLDFRVDGERSAGQKGVRPEWRVKEPGEGASAEVSSGSRVSTGTVLELSNSGGHGTLFRPDGLRLYAERGVRLTVADDATEKNGLILESGHCLLHAPEGVKPFTLDVSAARGTARIRIKEAPAQVFVQACPDSGGAVASVLSGSLSAAWAERSVDLGIGESLLLGPGRAAAVVRQDLRAFAFDFVPPSLRPSAWPMRGGSAARGGASPFRLAGAPAQAADIDGVNGASAVVLAPDGTVYFLAGPPPGRLVTVDISGATGRMTGPVARFDCPCAGDPALGPDGRIYVCTRDGAVWALDPQGGTDTPVAVVAPSPGGLPRTGPAVAPDGSLYVVCANGLAAFSPDGALRWRRNDVSVAAPPSVGPGGAVFAAALGGRLHVIEAATGRDLAGEELSVGEAFLSHVAVGLDGTAYAVSAGGKLVWYAGEGESGTLALAESDFPLAPAITGRGEVVVASSTGTVYRLPARPTAPPAKAFFGAGEPVVQGPLVDADGLVILVTKSGALVTVDPTGRSRTVELGAGGASPPAIARDGSLVLVTRDGRVFAGHDR